MSACILGTCRIPECCGGYVPPLCAAGCGIVVGMEGDACTDCADCRGCGEPLRKQNIKVGYCDACHEANCRIIAA
jgi:hypothetical protein